MIIQSTCSDVTSACSCIGSYVSVSCAYGCTAFVEQEGNPGGSALVLQVGDIVTSSSIPKKAAPQKVCV